MSVFGTYATILRIIVSPCSQEAGMRPGTLRWLARPIDYCTASP